jgi:hypothetical protein
MQTTVVGCMLAAATLFGPVVPPALGMDQFVLILEGEGASIAIRIGGDQWRCARQPPRREYPQDDGRPGVTHPRGARPAAAWPARVEPRRTTAREKVAVTAARPGRSVPRAVRGNQERREWTRSGPGSADTPGWRGRAKQFAAECGDSRGKDSRDRALKGRDRWSRR